MNAHSAATGAIRPHTLAGKEQLRILWNVLGIAELVVDSPRLDGERLLRFSSVDLPGAVAAKRTNFSPVPSSAEHQLITL